MANLLDVLSSLNPITAVINTVIDRIIPDKAKAQEAKDALAAREQQAFIQQELGQINVNLEEAKSSSVFVAGWRPFVGWVCGMSLAYVALVEPMARFASTVWFKYAGAFPVIDTNLTMQVLLGMLGMGYLRSQDKKNGVAS